jgi:hypothetical protein
VHVQVDEEARLFRLKVLGRALRTFLRSTRAAGFLPVQTSRLMARRRRVWTRPRRWLSDLGASTSVLATRSPSSRAGVTSLSAQSAERRQEVLARDLVDVGRAPAAAVLVPPPREQLLERHGLPTVGERLEAEPLAIGLVLEVAGEHEGFGLGPALGPLLAPAAGGVAPAR